MAVQTLIGEFVLKEHIDQTSRNLIGTAIGTLLADSEGMTAVFLPAGTSQMLAESVVRAANEIRLVNADHMPPFSILVADKRSESNDPECPIVSPAMSLRYRKDHRLVVLHGQAMELASFDNSTSIAMDADYPGNVRSKLSLSALGECLGRTLLSTIGAAGLGESAIRHFEVGITACLVAQRNIHEQMAQSKRMWNVSWFESVERGAQRLAAELGDAIREDPSLEMEEFLGRLLWACFGLPRPEGSGISEKACKQIVDSFNRNWGSGEACQGSVKQLAFHPDTDEDAHALSSIEWEGFDEACASEPSVFAAFQEFLTSDRTRLHALGQLTLRQFISPDEHKNDLESFSLVDPDGASLSIANGQIDLLLSELVTEENSRLCLRSQLVIISIPCRSDRSPSPEDIAEIRVSVDGRGNTWTTVETKLEQSKIRIEGYVSIDIKGKDALAKLRPRSIALEVTPDADVLTKVNIAGRVSILVAPPEVPCLVSATVRGGRTPKVDLVGPENVLASGVGRVISESPYALELDGGADRIELTVVNAEAEPIVNGQPMPAFPGRSHCYSADIPTRGDTNVYVGDDEFRLFVPESYGSLESPVLAAVERQIIKPQSSDSSINATLQGNYESMIGDLVRKGDWKPTLGHAGLPTQEHYEFGGLSMEGSAGVLTTRGMLAKFARNPQCRIQTEVLDSVELREFKAAFEALGINEVLADSSSTEATPLWPSKVSWRHLLSDDDPRLEAYLDAYASLVDKARATGHPYTIFWASFPWSMSIWNDTSPALDCTAVLVSPLHPLRLAWLVSAENTLWESESLLSRALAGTIEGWNFPFLATGASGMDRLVAIPTDAGAGQVFLGWSMLVKAPLGVPSPPQVPVHTGKFQLPGSAASGLNGPVTRSALRSFKRLSPHLTTLVADLSASSRATRLADVDRAILEVAGQWISDAETPLMGGLRVTDSSMREGQPPLVGLSTLIQDNPDVPITWERYDPLKSESPASNVRFVSDAASLIAYSDSQVGESRGVVGNIPLRRFEISALDNNNAYATEARPGIDPPSDGSAFQRALSAVENVGATPSIMCQLAPQIMDGTAADWTVTGEVFLSPTSLVDMLQDAGGGNQMLWEWRPPFLNVDGKRATEIQSRPFVSITRISSSFKSEIREVVELARGESIGDEVVGNIVNLLGARGIGLSTLLSMGGNHVFGAIGFYLALSLNKGISFPDQDVLILPIDACDVFLRALIGDSSSDDLGRRADLLIISIRADGIVLSPLEIKCYGLGSPGGIRQLPTLGDASTDDPKAQLKSTQSLISALVDQWADLRRTPKSANYALWMNGFVSLIDSALRMSPVAPERVAVVKSRLQSLMNGELNLVGGHGLITYFGHSSEQRSNSESRFKIERDEGDGSSSTGVGLLSAVTGDALRDVSDNDSHMKKAWRDLLFWAGNPDKEEQTDETRRESGNNQVRERDGISRPGEEASDEVGTIEHPTGERSKPSLGETEYGSRAKDPNPPVDGEVSPNDGVKVEIGRLINSVGGAPAYFWPGDTRLNQMNIGVVGDLGTGKTQIVRTLVAGIRSESEKTQALATTMLILDYKGDYTEPEFLERVGGKYLAPEELPLNVFGHSDVQSPAAFRRKAMAFFDVIARIYSKVGPVQRSRFATAVTGLYSDSNGVAPTLGQVLEAYEESGKPDSVSAILSDFVYGNIFSENPDELVSFDELIEGNVLVIDINALGPDQALKNALVVLMLNQYFDYMKRGQKPALRPGKTINEVRTIKSYLLVDEANNIMKYNFDVLQQIMLESREYGFGVILSSQYLRHFENSSVNYAEPLNSWLIHKVPDVSPKQLTQLGLPAANLDTAAMIKTQENLHSFYSSYGYPGRFISDNAYFATYGNDEWSPSDL